MTTPADPYPLRQYLLAIMPGQRKPRRIPRRLWPKAVTVAQRWWLVQSPCVADARALCIAWPSRAEQGTTRILNTGKNTS